MENLWNMMVFNGRDSGTDLLDVPTTYVWPIFQGYVREYALQIWPYMVQYLHFWILKFPLKLGMINQQLPRLIAGGYV